MKYLPVHSYGTCLNNKEWPSDIEKTDKVGLLRRYKFVLAFEYVLFFFVRESNLLKKSLSHNGIIVVSVIFLTIWQYKVLLAICALLN